MAIVSGTIRCSACGDEKPLSAYLPSDISRGSGRCRSCKNAAKKAWRVANRDKNNAGKKRRYHTRSEEINSRRRVAYATDEIAAQRVLQNNLRRYGLTISDYTRILEMQGGKCACCGGESNKNGRRMYVDHCHQSGRIRGLLCHKCNAGIGALGDNLDGVLMAVKYLERSEAVCHNVAAA